MQKESLRQLALVVGLGASGQACALHLARRGWTVRVADTREAPAGATLLAEKLPSAEIVTGGLPESLLEGVSLVVMSPGLSPFLGRLSRLSHGPRHWGLRSLAKLNSLRVPLKP